MTIVYINMYEKTSHETSRDDHTCNDKVGHATRDQRKLIEYPATGAVGYSHALDEDKRENFTRDQL